MSNEKIIRKKEKSLIALIFILGIIETIITFIFYKVLKFRLSMLWNIFLALLPLILSILIKIEYVYNFNRIIKGITFLLWLFIFPNSPYILTDYIHVTRYKYYEVGVEFIPNATSWLGFLHLSLGIIIGILTGMLSLYYLHKIVENKHNKVLSWFFVIIICLLSGVAVSIGRINRFNSWDILTRPFNLIIDIFIDIDLTTIMLYFIFASMTFLLYIVFYFCFNENESKNDEEKILK